MERLAASVLMLLAARSIAAATPAGEAVPSGTPATIGEPSGMPAAIDPPRWRLRAALTQGVGGAVDGGQAVTIFPITVELGARVFGPLSVTLAAQGTLVGAPLAVCGLDRRPNALAGTAGARVDFANGKSGSWLSPFVEIHAGVGTQPACPAASVFGTAGARLGLDVWLGRAAVTVAVAFDYLPVASPVFASLGATVILF